MKDEDSAATELRLDDWEQEIMASAAFEAAKWLSNVGEMFSDLSREYAMLRDSCELSAGGEYTPKSKGFLFCGFLPETVLALRVVESEWSSCPVRSATVNRVFDITMDWDDEQKQFVSESAAALRHAMIEWRDELKVLAVLGDTRTELKRVKVSSAADARHRRTASTEIRIRDELWLAWNDTGMKPAAIRDKWNAENPQLKVSMENSSNGLGTIKSALRRAKARRESE